MSRKGGQGSPQELDADEERGDRMRWNKANQARFEAAVEAAGGVLYAMPRAILDALDLPGVSYAQVKSHLQRYRTAYVADCLARGEVVDVSEAQLRASQALLEKRGAASGGRPVPTSSRRRPASSMQRSDGSSPPQSLRQRPRSESVAPTPMATDGISGSAGGPAEQQAQGWVAAAAAAAAPQGGAAGLSPVVRASGSGEGCNTAVSGSEQASEPRPASSLAPGHSRQPGSATDAAAAAAAVAAVAAAVGAPSLASGPAVQQQTAAGTKLESLLLRVQQLQTTSDLLVAQMQEQQQQHQRAWQAMQQALESLQRECALAILEATHEQGTAMQPATQPAVQQQPQLPLLQPGGAAASLQAAPSAASGEAQLLQTLLALSSQQQPAAPQQAQQTQQPPPPLQLGSQGGLWEQRLRAQLAGGAGDSSAGMAPGSGLNYFQPFQLNSLGQQPPAGQLPQPQLRPQAGTAQQQQGQQQAQQQAQQGQQAQQAALPVDDAVSMLLNCFPAAVGSGDIGSDLQALLKSSGSDSGDSLLGSLLRAAGGQPGVDDLTAMLSSL